MGLWLLLALLFSGASTLMLWRNHWQELHQDQRAQLATMQGLLELRVNQHRTTALDWGHWDTMLAFASGQDPDFVERELKPSSIVTDRQVLMGVTSRGQLLTLQSEPGNAPSAGLLSCLRNRLWRLRTLTPQAPPHTAFGLLCRVDQDVFIGAGTGIRASNGVPPEGGWLIHVSTLERPSYNDGINSAFRTINGLLTLQPKQQASRGMPVASISQLLPDGEQFVLRPPLGPAALAARAVEKSLPPWLALNLLLAVIVPVGLLLARQRRLTGRIKDWQDIRSERKRRHQISQWLLNRRHLLMAFQGDPDSHQGAWISAVQLTADSGPGPESGRGRSRERVLYNLVLSLRETLQPRTMGLMDQETLLLAFEPIDPDPPQTLHTLTRLLQDAQVEAGATRNLQASCCVAPLQARGQVQQVLNLCRAVAELRSGQRIAFLSDGAGHAPEHPSREPAAAGAPALDALMDGLVRQEPVVAVDGDQHRILYQELLFDPTAKPTLRADTADWIDARGHNIDLYMIRQAAQHLRNPIAGAEAVSYGIHLSVESLIQPGPFSRLQAELQSLPAELRHRLVLELAETELMGQPDHCAEQVQALQQLGLRMAIDEFGSSHLPIQPLFALKPNFLRLSPGYTQQLHDENIDSTVDFLLSYCRYKHCIFVLNGVETRQQLLHWQRKGARVFQGELLTSRSALPV